MKSKDNSVYRNILEETPQSINAVQNGFVMKKKLSELRIEIFNTSKKRGLLLYTSNLLLLSNKCKRKKMRGMQVIYHALETKCRGKKAVCIYGGKVEIYSS